MGLFERIRLTGMYGAGQVEDDFDADGQPDYTYSGWEAGAMFRVIPRFLEAGAALGFLHLEPRGHGRLVHGRDPDRRPDLDARSPRAGPVEL